MVCVFTEPMALSLFDVASHSVYFWARIFRVFAGFPHRDGLGVMTVHHDGGDLCTPESVCRSVRPGDLDEASAFFRRHMPRALGRSRHTNVGP